MEVAASVSATASPPHRVYAPTHRARAASAYVCFIMPAAFAWRLRERIPQLATTAGRAGCVGLFLVGLLVGVMSTSATIAGLGSRPEPINACDPDQVAKQMCAVEPGSGDLL